MAAGVAALLLGAAAAELLRSGLERSDALRESLAGAAASQLGLELEAGEIELRLWPPELVLAAPQLALPENVRIELGSTRVGVAPRLLLEGVADVRRVSLDGPARLVHPRGEIAGRLALELAPEAEASAGWSIAATAEPSTGGTLSVRGGLLEGGRFVGSVEIDDVESEPFAVFLSSERGQVAGLSGRYRGRFERPAPSAGPATLRLSSDETILELAPVRLEGPVALVAELPPGFSSDAEGGRFAIDATGATVEYAGDLAKASGRGASLVGHIVRGPDGRIRFEEVALKVLRFEGEVPAETGDARSQGGRSR